MTREEIERMAFETDPSDGLRVKEVKYGDERSIHLGFYVKGRPVRLNESDSASREVWNRSDLKDKDHGDKDRARLLLEAVCRFLNTGGTWSEINWLVSEVKQVSHCGLVQFDLDGFYLINSTVNTDGAYEHLFAKDDCPYLIRWVEGQFFDVITETGLFNESRRQAAENETEDAARSTQPGPEGGQNQLPGPGDRGTQTEAGEVAE